MQADTIEYKVNIFISSKCGGRYTIVRKALKNLLIETGMANVYIFETAPASSQSIPDAYLQHVDESHVCLIIIDNKDGVPNPVLAECQRAKELGKKIICIFCDEKAKKPTQLEEEIRAKQIGKYYIVHEFSDITEVAYKSVIQDIVDTYKKKMSQFISTNTIIESSKEKVLSTTTESYIIDKNMFKGFDKTQNGLVKKILPFDEKVENSCQLDDAALDFLNVVLCKNKFDRIDYDKICDSVLELHRPEYKEIISLRMKALKFYYQEKIVKCIDLLKEALQLSSNNPEIANWISNDIAIDLRYIIYINDGTKLRPDNEGQKFIDNNSERVYFPVLDRLENNIKENILKQYLKMNTDSPYTVTIGGHEVVFKDIAMSYCTALIYGSIAHIQETRSHIIDALSALCLEYSDHDLFLELIAMLIIERRDKELDNFIRIYNQSVDIVNSHDIETIQSFVDCIPLSHNKIVSEFILFKHFGYYLNDTQFTKLTEKLISFSFDWVNSEKRIYSFGKFIFDALKANSRRIDIDILTKFIIEVLSMNGNRWYDDACLLSCLMDFSLTSGENQINLLEKSIEIIRNEQKRDKLHTFKRHLLHFRLTATIDMKPLDDAIQNNMCDFYSDLYKLELNKDKKSCINDIKKYLNDIKNHNKQWGKNGVHFGYDIDPYITISNIIKNKNLLLRWGEIRPIIETAKDTLLMPTQSYQDKCKAIQLIVFLKNYFNYAIEWNEYIYSLTNLNAKIIICGNSLFEFEKETEKVLNIVYQMMIFIFNKAAPDKTINSIINISSMMDCEIIKCLEYIDSMLDRFDYSLANDTVILSITLLMCNLINHKERDIRFFAIKCLIQLTHSKYSKIILPQLSLIMDKGTSVLKVAILSRVKKIKNGEKEIIDYIIQKGKVDNNFFVRKIANEIGY